MSTSTPDWLKSRGGELKAGRDGHAWSVLLSGQPQYLLEPLPAKGKFTCRVLQTNNGRRFDGDGTFDTKDSALQGGLDALRETLGW